MHRPLVAALLALTGALAQAQTTTAADRAPADSTAPVAQPSTVNQVVAGQDGAYVTLEGTIVRRIGGDRYEFRDTSGSMTVEIDEDIWPNRQPVLNRRVRLQGEVDRKLVRRTVEIEVERIEMMP